MKRSVLSKIMMVGVLALSLAVVSVSAQTGTDGGRTDGTTASQTTRDDDRDWGWVGLLGLLGLTGLMRRREAHDRVPDTTTRATAR
jgi:MYXO-CTERM domain-containing protein